MARLVSEGTDSIAESGMKIVLDEGRVEAWVQQHPLTTRTGRRYFADFCWPGHKVILEFDGQVKYGGRYGKAVEVIREEHRRQRELETMGWTVVRASWEDITRFRRDLVERLRAAGVRVG